MKSFMLTFATVAVVMALMALLVLALLWLSANAVWYVTLVVLGVLLALAITLMIEFS